MLHLVAYHVLNCDQCGAEARERLPGRRAAALGRARYALHWEVIRGMHYCPDCAPVARQRAAVARWEQDEAQRRTSHQMLAALTAETFGGQE